MSAERLRLRISGMLCAITIDRDVARASGVFAGVEEVSFTRARVLLEAQWLKDQRANDLAAHSGLPRQEEQQTKEPNTMTTEETDKPAESPASDPTTPCPAPETATDVPTGEPAPAAD